MMFLDGTGWENAPGLDVPVEWGLAPLKFLYNSHFYAPGADRSKKPTAQRVKECALDTVGLDHVCIDIGEKWPLLQPGTWGWDQVPDPEAVNDNTIEQMRWTLAEFRKHNTTSKLSWWNMPRHLPGYDLKKYAVWGWLGPEAEPYAGHVGLMMYALEPLRGLVDYGHTSGYWPTAREPEFNMALWQQVVLHARALSECGLGVPCMITLRALKVETGYFERDQLAEMLDFLRQVLSPDDAVVLWEGPDPVSLNKQLSDYIDNGDWISQLAEFP